MSIETWLMFGVIAIALVVFVAFVWIVAVDSRMREQEYERLLDEYWVELRAVARPKHVRTVRKIHVYDQDADGVA